jgi:hypothetical protein
MPGGPRAVLVTALGVSVLLLAPTAAFGAYQGRATSIHPGAINHPGRNWTYRGDTLRVAFRNTALAPGETQRYKVCYTRNFELACQTRTLRGPRWDAWRLRVMPPWAGYIRGRIGPRTVAAHRAWIYE